MFKLYDWIYNRRLNMIGIITEENSGQYEKEYAIFYPGYEEAHNGRGYSHMKYANNSVYYYTNDLMSDRIMPFDIENKIMLGANNFNGCINRMSTRRALNRDLEFFSYARW